MIGTSITASVPFTPAWLESATNPPRFHLRAGSVIERGALEAELAGEHRAARVLGYELLIAIRSGVAVLLAGDPELDRVQGLIETEAEMNGVTDGMLAEDRLLLAETRKILSEHWPEYRELLARQSRRNQIAPILALQRFCVGWDNVSDAQDQPIEYARDRDGVSNAAMSRLQPLELLVAGNRAYAMLYGGDQAGNSQRPSSSGNGPQTSNSGASSKAAGRSANKRGRKTRASRSPRGSGRSSTSTSPVGATPRP